MRLLLFCWTVEAIFDEDDNPTGEDIYYVYEDKCVECVGHYDAPSCAEACPTEGCIIWGPDHDNEDRKHPDRKPGEPCVD